MLLDCLLIACIFGICPFIEKNIIKHIQIESFILICAVFFLFFSILLVSFGYHQQLYHDVLTLNKNIYLYGLIILFVFLFYFSSNYLYLHILQKHEPAMITTLTSVYPLITIAIAVLFLESEINIYQMVGSVCIVSGVVLLQL